MYFVDTHTHIYDKEFDTDRAEVVQRAVENGVQMLLLPNVDAATIAPMLDTFGQFPDHCRVMMGLQPEEVREDYKKVMACIEKELEKNIYVSVKSAWISIGTRLLRNNSWKSLSFSWIGRSN